MKLHIESDGTIFDTVLCDENGNQIEGVTKIEWVLDASKDAEAHVVLTMVGVALSAEVLLVKKQYLGVGCYCNEN